MIKAVVHTLGRAYQARKLSSEYYHQEPDPHPNERSWEYSFALSAFCYSPYHDVLDVGTGESAWPALLPTCGYKVTAVDEMGSYWHNHYFNRHFFVFRHNITSGPMNGASFGIIHCLSVLEHIPDPDKAVAAMVAMLKPGGILVMTFPYNEHRYVPNAYDLDGSYGKGNPFICQMYDGEHLNRWIQQNSLQILDQRYCSVFDSEFWSVGDRLKTMRESKVDEPHHLTGVVLTQRSSLPTSL